MKKIDEALTQFEESLNNSQGEREKKKIISQFAGIAHGYSNDELEYLIGTDAWKNRISVDIRSEFNQIFKTQFLTLIKFKFSDENAKTTINFFKIIKIIDKDWSEEFWNVTTKKDITVPLVFHYSVKGELEKVKYLIETQNYSKIEDKSLIFSNDVDWNEMEEETFINSVSALLKSNGIKTVMFQSPISSTIPLLIRASNGCSICFRGNIPSQIAEKLNFSYIKGIGLDNLSSDFVNGLNLSNFEGILSFSNFTNDNLKLVNFKKLNDIRYMINKKSPKDENTTYILPGPNFFSIPENINIEGNKKTEDNEPFSKWKLSPKNKY